MLGSISRLIDYLLAWLIDWLIDCLLAWLIDWLIDWSIDCLIGSKCFFADVLSDDSSQSVIPNTQEANASSNAAAPRRARLVQPTKKSLSTTGMMTAPRQQGLTRTRRVATKSVRLSLKAAQPSTANQIQEASSASPVVENDEAEQTEEDETADPAADDEPSAPPVVVAAVPASTPIARRAERALPNHSASGRNLAKKSCQTGKSSKPSASVKVARKSTQPQRRGPNTAFGDQALAMVRRMWFICYAWSIDFSAKLNSVTKILENEIPVGEKTIIIQLIALLDCRLIDWLIDGLIDWSIGRLIDWLVDWLIDGFCLNCTRIDYCEMKFCFFNQNGVRAGVFYDFLCFCMVIR